MSPRNKLLSVLIPLLLTVVAIVAFSSRETLFGAGYRPTTNYDARTTTFLTAAATSISVNTTKDKSNQEITLANLSSSSTVYAYFTIEPGITGKEELVACSGKSTNTWSSCLRGLAYQGGSMTASSTLAQPHNAGSRIIMSNIGQFYGEFVSITGDETLYGVKTFNSLPKVTSTTAVPTSNDQLTPWYAAQTLVAGGFSSLNIDTDYGLTNAATAPEKVRVNISATSSGLLFDGSFGGKLGISTSSTGSTSIDSLGRLYVDTSVARTWSGAQTFGAITANGTAVFNAGVYVNTPAGTDAGEAVNVGYIDREMFGDGSDGALSIQSSTTTLNTAGKNIYQYTSVTIGGTGALTTGANLDNKPLYIFVQGDLIVTSTAVAAVYRGGKGGTGGVGGSAADDATAGTGGATAYAENGGGRGRQDNSASAGGGGGGYGSSATAGQDGGAGGNGGVAGATSTYATLRAIGREVTTCFMGGGGGGGGRDGSTGNAGGAGGAGGGCIIFIVGGNINISGNFNAAGVGGSNGVGSGVDQGGGGGGGGGGFVGIYYSGSVTANTATFTVSGGAGGTGAKNGGAGGAGQYEVRALTVENYPL